jgi:hypothetical protein
MSVRAFMSDDSYESGNPHYRGRIAGRYATRIKDEENTLGEEIANAIPRVMPTILMNYMLLRTADKVADRVGDAFKPDGPPAVDKMELAKAAAITSIPASLVAGFLGAVNKTRPKSVLGAVLGALK